MNNVTISGDQFILFTLILKLGVMASLATIFVSSARFKRLLFAEEERIGGKQPKAGLLLALLFAFGVSVRILMGFGAADLSLPGVFLIGLLSGMGPGVLAGALIAFPALLNGEYLSFPFLMLCGLAGGSIRHAISDRSMIWSFSPLPFLNIYRYVKSALVARKMELQLIIFLSCLGLDIVHYIIASRYPDLLFELKPDHFGVLLCMFVATLSFVGIPLKIWNSSRLEQQLEQQEHGLVEARYLALKSQINPHFLFNTLNSISSCMWNEPQKARWIIVKLSEILRRLLRSEEMFVSLNKELEFIDSYLQIESIRFGEDKLIIKKSIDPRVLDVLIPGMILQPFIENAIKHGIAPLLEGGVIEISAEKRNGVVIVVIRDNGKGIRDDYPRRGIGIQNVLERMRMMYGQGEWCIVERNPEGGTRVELRFPDSRQSMIGARS